MNTQPSRDYQRAMLGAAAALVGVVVVYIGFVLGLIAFTAWHATAHPDWMQRGFAGSLLYVSPILMGALITLFLIKPLFARQIPPPPSRPINHEEHPRLFQFIGAICREVGSQPPSRVEVDCAINASVRFREGLASLNEGDLTLTLGLPLVAGLPAAHLGGVIAILIGCVAWSLGSITSRHAQHGTPPAQAAALQMLGGGAALLLVAALHGDFARCDLNAVSLRSWLAFVYLVGIGSLVGYSTFVWLMKNCAPAHVATYGYVNPIVAVFLGWLILDEPINARTLVASAIIIASVILITLEKSKST
jgi:uncharacterized membrane protein